MRSRYVLIALVLVILAFGVGRLSAALGTVDSPALPENTQSYTLEDIYNRLDTGAAGAQSTFTEPAAGPGTGTMHDLNDIMDKAPAADNTNGAVPGEVLTGKTYWSLRTGPWGTETGTMPDREGDNASTAQAESAGVNYFIAPDGYYDGDDTVTATDAEVRALDTDIVSGNIRSSVNIFGVDGDPMVVNTSSGDAAAGDIKDGKKAWVGGAEVTGSIATQTVSNTTVSQLAGYYDAFSLSLVDTDLVSGNIRSTVSIYGVAGDPNVVNTSSGDAAAGDIKDGKKAWVDGSEVTGELYGGCTCTGIITPTGGTRWCDNEDGTVTDLTTCLVWVQNASWGGTKKWEDCTCHDDAHTRASSYGGYMDNWRLPTLAELYGLTHGTEAVLSGTPRAFTGVQSDRYWSSTTHAYYPDDAWRVKLSSGVVSYGYKDYDAFVWPVRGGQ